MRQPVAELQPSPAPYTLIKWTEAEGGRARLRAYRCPVGIWTIGWGHTAGVQPGDTCTVSHAEAFLQADAADAVGAVRNRVKVPLEQGEFDALVSFVFNIRRAKWKETECTLLRKLNKGDYLGAAGQFQFWVNGIIGGKMARLPGLVKRRKAERAVYAGEPIEEALKFITGERS